MKGVLTSLARGETTFAPHRSWDPLMLRLFPEVAPLWLADPRHVATDALKPHQQAKKPQEVVA